MVYTHQIAICYISISQMFLSKKKLFTSVKIALAMHSNSLQSDEGTGKPRSKSHHPSLITIEPPNLSPLEMPPKSVEVWKKTFLFWVTSTWLCIVDTWVWLRAFIVEDWRESNNKNGRKKRLENLQTQNPSVGDPKTSSFQNTGNVFNRFWQHLLQVECVNYGFCTTFLLDSNSTN